MGLPIAAGPYRAVPSLTPHGAYNGLTVIFSFPLRLRFVCLVNHLSGQVVMPHITVSCDSFSTRTKQT